MTSAIILSVLWAQAVASMPTVFFISVRIYVI